MKASIVLTVIGPDHPGLVTALSEAVAAHGGNWEESRMAHLGGHFAGLLHLEVEESKRAALETALGSISGLSVTSALSEPVDLDASIPLHDLAVLGQDREGIVLEIARVLSRHEVNVEELTSTCESAPMSGETLFRATARLRIPSAVSPEELRDRLQALGDDLMVDVSLSAPE